METIAGLLAARNLAGFVGLKEDQWFDAKRPPGYDLATAAGRFHLAKDVSSFANAEGGHIIVGLTTVDVPDEQTEQVNGLELLSEAAFNGGAIQGVLNEYLHPRLQGLTVTWVEDVAAAGQGVGVIRIPALDHDRRFVLMKQVLDADTLLPQIVFGIAVRHGSNSIPFTVEQLHRICQEGRSSVPHTWSGFSTGEWDGDTLVVTTTHLKEAYLRRWGIMRSDRAVVRNRWKRMGDYLQATSILYDPVYMAEPYIRTTMMWIDDPNLPLEPYPCEEATEVAVPRGTVPHFLPGQNPLPGWNPQWSDVYGTPFEARLGGPETQYPEYVARMKKMPKPPTPAPRNSGGGR